MNIQAATSFLKQLAQKGYQIVPSAGNLIL